jgi:hypothetical protein
MNKTQLELIMEEANRVIGQICMGDDNHRMSLVLEEAKAAVTRCDKIDYIFQFMD